MTRQTFRVPTRIEQSANAPGFDAQAIKVDCRFTKAGCRTPSVLGRFCLMSNRRGTQIVKVRFRYLRNGSGSETPSNNLAQRFRRGALHDGITIEYPTFSANLCDAVGRSIAVERHTLFIVTFRR